VALRLSLASRIFDGPQNTRDKLRSSNMLGFVSFIPLLDGLVVPPTVVSPAQPTLALPCHREHGNADAKQAGCAPATLAWLSKGVAEERRPQ